MSDTNREPAYRRLVGPAVGLRRGRMSRVAGTLLVVALWAVALVLGAYQLHEVWITWWRGSDVGPTAIGASNLLHGVPVPSNYVYTPGLLAALAPLAALPGWRHAGAAALALEAVGLFAMFWLMRRVIGLGWTRLAIIALAMTVSGQVIYAFKLGNLTLILLPIAAGFYLATVRNRWLIAGVLLGISLTVKPMLLAFLVVLLAARKWRASALALAIPAVLSAVALAVMDDPIRFLIHTGRILLANASGPTTDNASLAGVGNLVGAPEVLILTARVLLALVAVAAAAALWRIPDDAEQIVWVTQTLTAALLLCFVFAHTFYGLLLLPIAFVTLCRPKAASSILGLAGVALVLLPVDAPRIYTLGDPIATTSREAVCAGLLLVLAAGAARAVELQFRRTVEAPAESTPASAA